MPFYDYGCEDCSDLTTLRRPFEERDRPVDCKSCGAPMHRLPAAPNFVVKGGTPKSGHGRTQ